MNPGDRADRRELIVCSKCGWHITYGHEYECSPAKGRAADALIDLVKTTMPNMTINKLGAGCGRVVFEVGVQRRLTFAVMSDGTYTLEKVFVLQDMPKHEAAALVEAFRRWTVGP